MNSSFLRSAPAIAIAGALTALPSGHAAMIPSYPTPGVENAAVYSFVAPSSGDVVAYFAGSSASYGSRIGMSIDSGPVMVWGLQNHTTAFGSSFTLGSVTAGQTIKFILDVSKSSPTGPPPSSYTLSSTPGDNPGSTQHLFAAPFAGGMGLPAGTYVGWEDISPAGASDFDYNDHEFVFVLPRSPRSNPRVPDGGTTSALFGAAFLGLPLLRRWLR